MQMRIMGLAGLALMLTLANAVQAQVNEPYVADWSFGIKGVFSDPLFNLVPTAPLRAAGQRLVLDDDGSTVVAGMATVWFFGDLNYLVVARYSANGQRQTWDNPSSGYTDDAHEYLFVQPVTMPEDLRLTAVHDVKIGPYGDINVLVDAMESATATTTDSLVVTFGPDGEYKSIVTHMATPGVDDFGAAMLPWGSNMFIISSTSNTVNVARYTLNLSNGVPDLDTTWASSGRASQSLWMCKRLVAGQLITVPCALRARRALISGHSPSPIYVAGEFASSQGGEADLFVMHFSPADGTSNAAYPFTWGFGGIDDGLRGLALRSKFLAPQRPQNELYLLNAFPRPCRSGFVVVRMNADTGEYINRSYTSGGGTDPDPLACSEVRSLEATDLSLPQNYNGVNRYLAVVGSSFSGEPYTGRDAFMAMVDTQDMHSTPQVQTFTENTGQYPDDSGFNAVTGDFATGTITATGTWHDYDHDSSTAVTMRMRTDRIFSDGFDF